jgi:hypothetical protein
MGHDFGRRVGEVLQHHQRFGARVGQLVLQFARGVQRVDVDDGVAGAQHGRHRYRILQHVGQHDRHARPRLQAAALQPGRHAGGQAIEFGKGHGLAHAGVGLAVGVLLEGFFQQVREGAVLRPVDLLGHVRLVRLQPEFVHVFCLVFLFIQYTNVVKQRRAPAGGGPK